MEIHEDPQYINILHKAKKEKIFFLYTLLYFANNIVELSERTTGSAFKSFVEV